MAYKPLYQLLEEAADWIIQAAEFEAKQNRDLAVLVLGDDISVPNLTYWVDEYAQRLVTDLEAKAQRHRKIAFTKGNEEE